MAKKRSAVTAFSGALLMGAALSPAAVINGGFETASGSYTTGALGWTDTSGVPGGTAASATQSSVNPFDGLDDLSLSYSNTAAPGGGPASSAQSDIFPSSAGPETLSFEALGQTIGFENNQVQVQWFGAGNVFLGASGFTSFQGTLTSSYTLQSESLTAPAGTTGAFIQFLEAGSAVPSDAGLTRIDDVALTSSAVPEPTSMGLVCAGGLILLSRLRRRTV